MATPQTPYDAVLHAARDVTKLESALDAEMLGSALLGSVYAIAETDRDAAVREFVTGFLAATARRRIAAATTIRQVFADARPDAEGADRVRPGSQAPAWAGPARPGAPHRHAGRTATCTATRPPTSPPSPTTTQSGGSEHALVALVDHNIGITKDIFVGGPAERILDQVRQMCADDELTWFRTRGSGPAARRGGPPPGGHRRAGRVCPARARSPPTARWSAPGWRLLPTAADPTGPAEVEPLSAAERTDLVRRFLAAPEAARFGLDAVDGAGAGLTALLPEPAAGPLGELPGRRPDALEPGGGRALPARLGAPPGRAGHGRRGDAAPGAARLGARTRPASAGCPRRRRRGPTRRSRRWCRSSPASTRPASGAARPPPRWRS